MLCNFKVEYKGRTYACIRQDEHSGPCIPQVLFEENDHHELHEAYE